MRRLQGGASCDGEGDGKKGRDGDDATRLCGQCERHRVACTTIVNVEALSSIGPLRSMRGAWAPIKCLSTELIQAGNLGMRALL